MICCGHTLSNLYKEGEYPDPGRLAMNRHQRAEDVFNIGTCEECVPTPLIVLQMSGTGKRERERQRASDV